MSSLIRFAAVTSACISICLPLSAIAETATPLDPLVVTASGTEQRRSKIAPAAVVFTREEIARAQVTDIGELLRFVAGLDVARSGGPGGQTSLFIRGGESDHSLILIDGTPINDGVSGLAPIPLLAPEMIERIEVIKGPRASLYGSSGIAGVVNIITRQVANSRLGASARIGDHGTRDLSARADWRTARGETLGVQIQRQRTDGIPPFTSSTEERGLDLSTLQISGRVPRDNWALDGKLWRAEGEVEYEASFSSNAPRSYDTTNRAFQIGLGGALSSAWQTRLSLHDLSDDLEQNDSGNYTYTRRTTLEWRNQFDLTSAQQLVAAANVSQEDLDASFGGAPVQEERRNSSAMLQWLYASDRQQLQANVTGIDHDTFGGHAVWNLEYGLQFAPRWRALTLAGTGFRAPTLGERRGFGFSFVGNPDLQPEESLNLELGMAWQPSANTELELRVFEQEIDNAILIQFDTTTFSSTPVNIDGARIRGAELSARADWQDWQLRLTTNVQEPEDRTTGQTLLRRSEQSAGLNLVRRIGGHSIGLDVRATGERPDIDPSTFARTTRGGFAVVNLTGTAQLGKGWTLAARIENLLDKDYETAAGFRQPDFTPYLSLRWSQ